MENNSNDILSCLSLLCQEKYYEKYFSKYLKLKELSSDLQDELINSLSNLLFDSHCTNDIFKYFSKYILQFLSTSILLDKETNSVDYGKHVKNCMVLSILGYKHPDAYRFTLKYFDTYPSPFDTNYFANTDAGPTKKKKLINNESDKVNDIDIVECCYNFLRTSSNFFREKWNWSEFINRFYKHKDDRVKWYCCQCLGIVTGMNERNLNVLLWNNFSKEKIVELSIYHDKRVEKFEAIDINISYNQDESFINKKICDDVISVSGILLPVYKTPKETQNLVQVKSTQSNLRKIALGIASNRAICLQGPVGSGKTVLVEYLASVTGREMGESFIKVQLGDQTDSKMLLGTYRCTDVPGEFVWQLGVLTQAVIDGSWLLLEDIDSASMDIATVITSLLENGYLTVPGYRDSISITPGFQLFVTQRLLPSISGYHKKHSNVNTLLEKYLMHVNIEPLIQNELVEIVKTLFPSLLTIATRIIDVFMLFTSCDMDLNIPKTGRLTSTRDLIKWCQRAIIDFNITSPNSALKVLQDAIDTFCCSLPKEEDRLRLATAICARLGIIETKAEYFCKSYKPSVSLTSTNLIVGRDKIIRDTETFKKKSLNKFSFTRNSACLLERIICCINLREPVLLVGETGTGKTSSIQYLAEIVGQKLIVINMNQQSDSADLLGGYKPVDLKFVIAPVKLEFELLFREYFSIQHNQEFLKNISDCYKAQKWGILINAMKHSQKAAIKRLQTNLSNVVTGEKSEEIIKNENFYQKWIHIGIKLNKLSIQLKQQNALAFAFIEGSLVKAIENGYWVLLDEINLANAETLECLSGLLEGSNRSLSLLEKGDRKPVKRHEKFTLFACMNPSTDVGKKDLPTGLRNRFTEFFVEELTEKNDLLLLVNTYLQDLGIKQNKIESIVKFYLSIRKEATINLCDGLGHAPHYSLRTLCRALTIAAKNTCGTVDRNLYEAFCLSFLTQLDSDSYKIVEQMIAKAIIGNSKEIKSILNQPIPEPKSGKFVQFEGYWVSCGGLIPEIPKEYILTQSVRKNLKDLVRVVSIGKLPVLLQGDTSVGKTSLITYLAKSSGNKCVRINNHEHTDLQEYIGSYVPDVNGKLVFREGVLVEAMRNGHWIILDELNLAPTDVLEALNRVLDDNRELFIPETQEVVKAHQNFMLFATQNPPGAYGGRKMLSRAFRNRFVELHFNEIPTQELEIILHKRCEIPPSYCKKMISVMADLQMRRRGSAAFAGKQGFITLRDLFRWGERYRLAPNVDKLYDWDQHIADEGYLVLAGRVRKPEERNEISEVLLKHIKRTVSPNNLFSLHDKTSTVTKKILEKIYSNQHLYKNIVWTFNTRQLAVLVSKAIEFNEPVLLVGETGGGKTTICKIIAENNGQQLITVNCHMHTESSDFIGGLRPIRERNEDNKNKLFEWVDGPLIKAMQIGDVFLADEISLADDSVLERLNSLLEPERSLLLAEKGIDLSSSNESEIIIAHERFHFIGTMNPGGDFGKKELSPALRNRFTEIWCESCNDRKDLIDIIENNLTPGIFFGNQQDATTGIGRCMMSFVEWFRKNEIGKRFTISIRDILTWVNFINVCSNKIDVSEAYIHGACLTFLDSFGSGVTGMENIQILKQFKKECIDFMLKQLADNGYNSDMIDFKNTTLHESEKLFGIKPFFVDKGDYNIKKNNFTLNAPTTRFNALRLLRGLQLNKAILLEGSPGVGKTSLVSALATITSHKLLRINLSDQTDISDLFGADLPVEGGKGGEFAWRDGPFLQALKNGDWIVLDELNLASQSVLEGLNACLDHRGEIFIPELGKTFHVKPNTKLFACQNPLRQGGSRRGLPKSFLNRFTQVYIDSLSRTDLLIILSTQFPIIPEDIREKMVEFNEEIVSRTDKYIFGYKGSPWEFNLRDLIRWCEVMIFQFEETKVFTPESSVMLIYGDRMRTKIDKEWVSDIFYEVFKLKISGDIPIPYITNDQLYLGDIKFTKEINFNVNMHVLNQESSLLLRTQYNLLRSLLYCVNLNWMAILVGSGASGKSSLVRTLAQLTGCELRTLPVNSAMDTMDILGGFEQVDYNRHLEDISSKMERIAEKIIQKYLIDYKDSQMSQNLLRCWEDYRNADKNIDNTNRTMAEETKRFTLRLKRLKEFLFLLKTCKIIDDDKDMLKYLETKLEKLGMNVETEGQLNAGGKFEWVDSILIKCLQDGCWLLIDNVNLCSPAVLDRLNALLEPNGILTIGERGVDENGEMINIKPHPNFRLFLTMDPKNGEISRAMRNRGVEIYVLNENESGIKNDLDLRAIIGQNGINSEYLQNLLVNIHEFITENIMGEKPTISLILQSSFLISQQLLRGLNIYDVIVNTILDVYVKSRYVNDFTFDKPEENIKAYIETLLKNDKQVISIEVDNKTLKTKNLQMNSKLELVKQQTILLKNFKVDDLFVAYSITSIQNLDLRHSYIKDHFNYLQLNETFYSIIKEFTKNKSLENPNLPLDGKWLPETFHQSINGPVANQMNLLMYFMASKIINHKDELVIVGKKYTKYSIMQYSKQIIEKKISKTSITNPLIVNYYLIIKEFDQFLLNLLNTSDMNLTDEDTIDCITILNWRFILERLGDLIIYDKSNKSINVNNILSELIVRYRWFIKFTITRFCINYDNNVRLESLLSMINKSIQSDLSYFKKISKRFTKNIVRPLPPTNLKQIENILNYSSILNNCTLNIDKNEEFRKRIDFVTNKKEERHELLRMKELCYEHNDIAIPDINRLSNIITKYEIENETNVSLVQNLPINDLFALYIIGNIRTNLIFTNSIDNEKVQILSKIITVPVELQGLLQVYLKGCDEKLFHEIFTSVALYYKISIALTPSKLLKWNEMDSEEFVDRKLLLYSPVLSYLVLKLYVSSDSKNLVQVTNLGAYRENQAQLQYLNKLFWLNSSAMSSENYDLGRNDLKYIVKSFKRFVEILMKTLNIVEVETLCGKVFGCISKMNDLFSNQDDSNEMVDNKNNFVDCLKQITVELQNVARAKDDINILFHTANIYCLLSYCKALLNTQLQLIDPLQKVVLKRQYCEEEKNLCKNLKESYENINQVYSYTDKSLHPYCKILEKKIQKYEDKIEHLSKQVAVRPENLSYASLIKDVTYNFGVLLSNEFFITLYKKVNNGIEKLNLAIEQKTIIDLNDFTNLLNEINSWVNSQENAFKKISKYRIGYPDIIEPILSNITEMSYGFKSLGTVLKKLIQKYEFKDYDLDLYMTNLIKFPTIHQKNASELSIIKMCTEKQYLNLIRKILETTQDSLIKQEHLRLLKCSLQELYNIFIVSSPNYDLSQKELYSHLNFLINSFVFAWTQQEIEKQKKIEEEKSIFKTKIKCDQLTEEEQSIKEIRELFKNYHEQDFSDFQEKVIDDVASDPQINEFVGIITDDDIKFVYDIHFELMQHFTQSEWLIPTKHKLDPNFVDPLLARCKTYNNLLENVIDGLSYKTDKEVINSLNILISYTKNLASDSNAFINKNMSPTRTKEKYFDFYNDSKVEEVKSCFCILKALEKRIEELLNEWPNHPTLKSIMILLQRIYSFSLTSPIARFLTGLEILLSKCQEWEENAHSGVTLSEHSKNLTLQIINWRKLELSCWKDSLNKTFEKTKNSVSKWWLHLYSIIQQFISEQNILPTQIIKVLKEFIEQSTLGEFESRLDLLYVFHCHTLHLHNTVKTQLLTSILWNLYCYYCQFVDNVNNKIKELRAPVEKKLKDFVKIARWNDINYWSIKETVEKTHRSLHKYIKEFENVLKESAKFCMVYNINKSDIKENDEHIGIWDRPQRHIPSSYHYKLDVSIYTASVFKFKKMMEDSNINSDKLFDKNEKYFTKSRVLCKNIILTTQYPELIKNVDTFVTEIVETSNHLKNLEVNPQLPKEKQKSQAKSILQQKRKALADLFRTLNDFGLSYRTGIIESKLKENSDSQFLLKPIDLKASFGNYANKSASFKQMINIWEGCETYYLRTISRFTALEAALNQPAPDLGLQNIERCKGFAAHLMVLQEELKLKLIDSTRYLYYLRHYTSQFTDWNDESVLVDIDMIKNLNELLTKIMIVMKQYEIILLSCPESATFDSDIIDVPLLEPNSSIFIGYRNEPNWNNVYAEIKNVVSIVQKIKSYLSKFYFTLHSNESFIDTVKYLSITNITVIINDLKLINDKIEKVYRNFGENCVSESLKWILQELELIQNAFDSNSEEKENLEKYDDAFDFTVEKLIENILLVIQNMYKKYNESNVPKDIEANNDDNEEYKENHLRVAVIENLLDDIVLLEMKKIFRIFVKLINYLNKMNITDSKRFRQILTNCIPLLEQLLLLYEYFVTQQVAAYRVTSKMTSILLNIFTELASKGFCVPPELSDDLQSQEGETKQMGGTGLGDGEGEKDVSDKIENEDQLDDAQPTNKEKNNDEDKDCKEEEKGIDMSEDFDSKLQDVDKPDDDEKSNSDDSDADKQMGDTEPNANQLDQQIWGSDEENDDDDEEEKNEKEERGDGGEIEDKKMAAKDNENKPNEDDDNNKDKRKEQEKDINEMDEKEYDDDQVDPYHGNQQPLPEPEPMDLPDDLQLDDGEEKEEGQEENPFDIDTMKEQMPPQLDENEKINESENKEDTNDPEDSSEEEDLEELKLSVDEDEPETEKDEQIDENEDDCKNKDINEKQESTEENMKDDTADPSSALDNQESTEDHIQPMDIDNTDNSDNVQTNPNQTQNNQQSSQMSQEESQEKDGVGQSLMEESETGHKGKANTNKDSLNSQNEKDVQEKRQRPGESDINRSLGEVSEPIKKKLKTMNVHNDSDHENEDEGAEIDKEADTYQHIKEAKETDAQVLDAATKEQAEKQKLKELENDDNEETKDDVEMDTDETEPEIREVEKHESEKTESKSDKKKSDGKSGDIMDEMKDIEVEGDIVETINVPRGTDSSYHTQYEVLTNNEIARLSTSQIQDLRNELENQLGKWNEPPPNVEAEKTWEKFSAVTAGLARDLSEQLRLVLEPTQASRLRGDFKTGRRINMRKVIPYIASQFRKDKIWLRRTKPSKREYQIVLAIDDSSSMDDNHSKELAFESVALISKALSLLESGQLSILSFGESTEVLHKLSDTFTEKSGVKLLQKFQFQQKKTCVANLVDFVTNMFSDVHITTANAKLLIVVSDGRGIFSEGEVFVQQAIRRAKFADIFMVFVIIDNPENKNSILDIRMPVFKDGKLLGIKSYLDSFPFPFYIILRDINSLPNVLSDALRQWFELVTNADN